MVVLWETNDICERITQYMKVHSERGIIVHHTKYSDHSVIAKIFLENLGMRACIVRGVGKRKGSKASFLRPLTRVKLQLSESSKSDILGVREITIRGRCSGCIWGYDEVLIEYVYS